MSYDKQGLGIAEMTWLSVNHPKTFQLVYDLMDTDETAALELARKYIEAFNRNLVGA